MVLGVQIVGMLFSTFMLYFVFLQYKRKELSGLEGLFWSCCWVLFMFVTLFPQSLSFIVDSLSLNRAMDLLTIFGFMFLIGLTFFNYTLAKKNKRKIEIIVRRLALNKARKL